MCGNSHENSKIAKRHPSQIFWSTRYTDHHSFQMASRPFRSSSWTSAHSFPHLWTFCTIIVQLPYWLHIGRKSLIINMYFCSTHVLVRRRQISARISQRAGLSIVGYITRSVDKNNHQVTCYLMVSKAMSHMTLPRMRELSPAFTSI